MRALQPPPDVAIPILGRAEEFEEWLSKYVEALKPLMSSLVNSFSNAGTVFFLLVSSHDVSSGDSEVADRTEGRVSGHRTREGV
jgi:hypothetical protein